MKKSISLEEKEEEKKTLRARRVARRRIYITENLT